MTSAKLNEAVDNRVASQTQVNSNDWQPILFPAREGSALQELIQMNEQQGASLQIFDTIDLQLRDLIQSRNPARKLSTAEIDSLIRERLRGFPMDEYGVWAHYPWSRRLVHLLDESEFAELRTNRNRYKITPAEQKELASKRVGIIGLSVGQSVAAVLALERSFGEVRLADFDAVELSNLNRIRAGVHSLGVPKIYATAREIAEIDPYLKVTPFVEGITEDNLDTFLLQGGKVDVIVEECDSLDIKILVRDRARVHRIPVVMDTSDRGMLDVERFDLEPDRPLFHGLAGDLRADELRDLTNEQKVSFVLRILGADTLSPRLRASLLEIEESVSTWPQLGSSVALGGAAAADIVRRINLGQTDESGRWFLDPESTAARRPASGAAVIASIPAPRQTAVDGIWNELVSDAILAPSGGNKQPWRWVASAAGGLDLYLDQSRTSGLIDFQYGGSYLALGCATENLVLAAHAAELEIQVMPFPSPGDECHVASFRFVSSSSQEAEPHWHDDLYAQIPLRETQRNFILEQRVATNDLELLAAAVDSVPGVRLQWQTGRAVLEDIASLVGAADRIRLLNPVTHREMFSEIRWSASEAALERDGIDIETLGLSPSDRAGLDLCRNWSSLEILSQMNCGYGLGRMAERQIKSAAAVGLISVSNFRSVDYFNAGRAVQRMWLTAGRIGIAVHPMTALIYFFARLVRGGSGFSGSATAELHDLRSRFAATFQVTPWATEVFLFRIGFGYGVTKRSLRRPVNDVLCYR